MVDNNKGSGEERPAEQRAGELWRLLNDPGRMIDDDLNLNEASTESEPTAAKTPVEERPRHYDEPRPDGYEDVDMDAIVVREQEPQARPDPVDVPEDFDPAVHEFVTERSLAVQCKNHPQNDAVGVCPVCEAYFCQPCLVIHRGRLICKECRETLAIRSEEEILSEVEYGVESDELEFVEKEKPEFQVSGAMFGLEGRPATPLKKLMALVIDIILIRGSVLILLFALDPFFSDVNSALFHLLEPGDGFDHPGPRILKALLLMQPLYPWLLVFFVTDYIYYFLCLAFANRTLGMSWVGCRIVTEWGDFVPFGQVALRTLVFLLLLGTPAVIMSRFFPAYRGPHDYAGGTVVINYDGVKRIDAYESVQIRL